MRKPLGNKKKGQKIIPPLAKGNLIIKSYFAYRVSIHAPRRARQPFAIYLCSERLRSSAV